MAIILHLETATKTCSVCISKDGKLVSLKEETSENFSHAENLNVFIEDVIRDAKINIRNLSAIAVSEGPGSYTGLRIGASTAKGLGYALDIPVITINSLLALAAQTTFQTQYVCPLFDARRMEVYSAVFDKNLNEIQKTKAEVIDSDSFSNLLEAGSVTFVGPGAAKCRELISHPNATFDLSTTVSSRGMILKAQEKFNANHFADLAYFEPFYLKDFVAGEKKKLV